MDPFEFGPADVGTDRPVIDVEASTAAAENELATQQEARRLRLINECYRIDPNGEYDDATIDQARAALDRLMNPD